ncbi:hypothetical protein Dda_9148 [Drechslerella dactyloides]|uniref:ribonuclease Z n=1 Tax=Drechslerella dactyloides TaxID=74499 RepID=A0AAD6IPT7_DREDA|nr:hypothetical protein Dda_9148 [Drechslerella dactyloides]
MKAYVELVTVPSHDNQSTMIVLHFDERRYMFGHVAEGTQRLITENAVRLTRVSEIFLSGKTEWKNNGGLTGLLLTTGDMKILKQAAQQRLPKDLSKYMVLSKDGTMVNPNIPPPEPAALTVHGGKNILHTIATARNFVFRENCGIRFHEFDFVKGGNQFKDSIVTVTPLRAFPRTDEGPTGAAEEQRLREMEDMDLGSRPQLEKLVDSMWNSQTGSLKVFQDDEDYVMSLVSRLKDDEERARQEKGPSSKQKNAASTDVDGESPPKRQKLAEDPKDGEEATWDGILDDESSKPTKPLDLPANRPLRRPWPASMTRALPGTLPSVASLSYMVGIARQRGKFLMDKVKELGIKAGPDFRILSEGGSVTLEDGTVVHSHQCLGPPRSIDGVAFLDIPNESYLESTIENVLRWKEDRKASDEHDGIGIWVWAVGPEMEKNERLLEFIKTLEGEHLLNSSTSPVDDLSLKGSSSQLARLNLLSEETFKLPCPDFRHHDPTYDIDPEANSHFVRARDSLILDIAPKRGLTTLKLHPRFDHQVVQEQAKTEFGNGAYWEEVKKSQYRIKEEEARRSVPPSAIDEVELIPLGTGSSSPSKYRNVSATIVTIPQVGHLLLDCGEATLNQMRRTYGDSGLQDFMKNLKILYISHLHADHHLGTVSVLKRWYQNTFNGNEATPKLYIVAPQKFLNILEEYSQIEDFGLEHITFIPCETVLVNGQRPEETVAPEVLQRVESMKETTSLEKVETSLAVHCRSSFTVAFTFKKPTEFKVAYSGDTRPTYGFVQIGRDCTVLVHEATFNDELMAEAVAKKHCTTSEAIQAGKDMGAKHLLLTHFSQRYPKLPKVETQSSSYTDENPLCDPVMEAPEWKEASELARSSEIRVEMQDDGPVVTKPDPETSMQIGFAFDLMRVKLKDFWKLEKFIPALQQLFKEEEKLEDTAEKPDIAPKKQKQKDTKQKQSTPKQEGGQKQGRQWKKKSRNGSQQNQQKADRKTKNEPEKTKNDEVDLEW